jgi:hypothetical protein
MKEPPGQPAGDAGSAEISTVPQQHPGAVVVVRRSGQGWQVGDEELPDLTSAMVLADLLAPELPASPPPAAASPPAAPGSPPLPGAPDLGDAATEAARLRVTVAQLQHALTTRVRVEQALGIIAERRRVPPREAFELLRAVARAGGTRVAELAARVVDSAVNPLLSLPEELARPPRQPRARGRSPRQVRLSE